MKRYKTKPPEILYENPPSEEFNRAIESFFCHGSCRGHCDICGREFLNDDKFWSFDENEVEEFKKNAKKYPGWYIITDYSLPIADNLFGVTTVVGCPCNGIRKFEEILWHYRSLIARYFEGRLQAQEESVKQNRKIVEQCKGIDKI